MKFDIDPFKGLKSAKFGALSLGVTRDAARSKLGLDFEPFQKDVGEVETDAYDALGLHLYYDQRNRLECVEAFDPASPLFRGKRLIGRHVTEVVDELSELGFLGIEIEMGREFPEAGMCLFAPSGLIEAVTVYRRGYYEDE